MIPAAIVTEKMGLPKAAASLFLSVLFIPLFFGLVFLVNRRLDQKTWNSLGWGNTTTGIPLLIVGFVSATLLIFLQNFVGESLGFYERMPAEVPSNDSLGFWGLLIFSLIGVSGSGFGEELAYRGYILRNLRTQFSTVSSVLISSVLFAVVVHFNRLTVDYFLFLTFFGILLAMLFLWTGSLWFVIGFHWSYNWTQSAIWGPGKRALLRIPDPSKPVAVGPFTISSEIVISIGFTIVLILLVGIILLRRPRVEPNVKTQGY